MKLETVALNLQLALAAGNSTSMQFVQVLDTTTEPQDDGNYPAVYQPGELTQNRIFITPFADTGPGSNFSVRIFGWNRAGAPPYMLIWSPFFIAELACVTADIPGPGLVAGSPAPIVPMTSNFCDTITLTQGVTGTVGGIWTGVINSTGPGTNLKASAILEIFGAQKISFHFQWNDLIPSPGMNCLWCYC